VAQLQEAKGDVIAFERQLNEARALLSDGKRDLYRQQLTDAAAKATKAAEQGAQSFKRAFFKGIGSPEWEDFLAAARRLAKIEGDGYPREDDHCLLCHRPLNAESAALIHRFWSFLESPVVREAEQARATVDRSIKSLAGLRLTFFSSETRVRRHITRLNPPLAKQVEVLMEMLVADQRAITDILTAGEGEIPTAVFGDVSSELEALKASVDADIARLQEQDMTEALRSLETERVLLRHRQVLSQILPDVETFVADGKMGAEGIRSTAAEPESTSADRQGDGAFPGGHRGGLQETAAGRMRRPRLQSASRTERTRRTGPDHPVSDHQGRA